MQVRGRALYNLLRLTKGEGQDWQLEDYRALADNQLFERLHALKILIDLENLRAFAQNVESPEELLEYLVSTESNQQAAEQIYLLLFEVWRRHFHDQHTLSVFCDELDHLMERYDEKDESVVEDLYNQLDTLVDLMDESVDDDQSEKAVVEYVASFLAHDLEHFFYDFVSMLIEQDNEVAATELIEGFEPYSANQLAFDLLKLKVYKESDTFDTENMVHRFGESIVEEKNGKVGIDYLTFLFHKGEMSLFFQFFPPILKLIDTRIDFFKLHNLTTGYLNTIDEEHTHFQKLSELLAKKQEGLKV